MTKIKMKGSSHRGGIGGSRNDGPIGDIPRKRKVRKSSPMVEVTGSSRGPGANELTSIAMNNEVPFCKVYSLKQKEAVERLLLNNRISYFVKWKEQSFLSRFFAGEKESVVFIIFIHDTMLEKARGLVKGMKGVKLLIRQ